jgi:hypothetical protein
MGRPPASESPLLGGLSSLSATPASCPELRSINDTSLAATGEISGAMLAGGLGLIVCRAPAGSPNGCRSVPGKMGRHLVRPLSIEENADSFARAVPRRRGKG